MIEVNNYFFDIARSKVHHTETIHKFGHNDGIGTVYEPISDNGIYRVPTALTSLEILSSDVNDTAAGTGARSVFVEGLSTDWVYESEVVPMNGTTAVALANQYYRVFRMYVVDSGTYATQSAGSHVGTLTLRESGAGQEWANIQVVGFPLGQTEIGAYTVPAGKIAFVKSVHIHVDSNKTVDIVAFQRLDANIVAAPYGAMRTWGQYHGVTGHVTRNPSTPYGPFFACTDIGFMGSVVSGTGSALIDFEIIVFDT